MRHSFSAMNAETLTVGAFEANCFVIWEDPASALIIDPGADAPAILAFMKKRRLKSAACLMTHGHVDHISAAAEISDSTGAAVYLHNSDLSWAYTDANSFPPFYLRPTKPSNGVAPLPDEGQAMAVAGFEIKVLHTPGHTPGSVCFLVGNGTILFSGDTLFAGSVGRTDLPGGNPRQLAASLKRLSCLPDSVAVYPGHGPCTSIGAERRINFFLRNCDSV